MPIFDFMMRNLSVNRDYLKTRHRLSYQQIDQLLGEDSGTKYLPEKLRQLDSVKTFLWVTDLFRQNNIPFVSLKGPMLSYRIYHDPSVRISHDMDILTDRSVIDSVVSILTKSGFRLIEVASWPQKKAQQNLIIQTCHHLSFYHEERHSCVEVHWALMNTIPISSRKQKNLLGENLTEIDFAGRKFTVLNKEFELLFLLLHGSRHGWNRLKWLIDIKDYPVDDIDSVLFEKLVIKLKAQRIIGQVNFLLNHFFQKQLPFSGGKSIPDYFIRYARESVDKEICITQSSQDIVHYYYYLWHMFPDVYYKFKLIAGILFRLGDVSEIDSSFTVVYFLYRPYSFIKRRIFHAA